MRTPRLNQLNCTEDVEVKVSYDPPVVSDIVRLINVEQEITISVYDSCYLFPLGRTWYAMSREHPPISYKGYISKFQPDNMENEKLPEATITITRMDAEQ